jgi:hypothetical protein
MALTVLTDVTTASNSRTLSWTIPTLATGDVVVISAVTWDQGNTQNVPTGTGLSFTQRVGANLAARDFGYIWTAVASSGGSSVVVSSSVLAGGASVHNGCLYLCPTADGYSLAGSPNVLSSTLPTNSAPNGNLAGTSGSLAIVAAGDYNGTSTSRTWVAATPTEDAFAGAGAGINTQYFGHGTLTGATTQVGLSAPTTGVDATVAAIEVLFSGAPPAAPDLPIIVQQPRRH